MAKLGTRITARAEVKHVSFIASVVAVKQNKPRFKYNTNDIMYTYIWSVPIQYNQV